MSFRDFVLEASCAVLVSWSRSWCQIFPDTLPEKLGKQRWALVNARDTLGACGKGDQRTN